jgi:nucleolar protein 12
LLKQLHRHILAKIPLAKIESTRFRSVPFQVPTSTLPTLENQESSTQRPKVRTESNSSANKPREHDRDRAASWREREETNNPGNDRDGGKTEEKIFLNPKQKKKIAFINQEFHSSADTVNAYVVFAHPVPAGYRPSNLPPPPQTMDPYEAARLAVENSDGTMFMDRWIRVDHVTKVSPDGAKLAAEGHSAPTGDPKLSIFVGNLDFTSKEEALRELFEQVVNTERGPPTGHDDEQVDGGEKKPKTWVTRVRIIRDKDTQLGKGFAYVQFAVSSSVNILLRLLM